MKYNLVQLGDKANLTAVIDGEMYVAAQDHPSWDLILQKVLAGDESVVDIFNPIQEVAKRFTLVSDRISIAGNRVFFDGDPVDNALTQQIVEFLNRNEDFLPLVNFYEKLATNPQSHSREQLYRWVQATKGLTITHEGDLVAYKGVYRVDDPDKWNGKDFRSSSSGRATVNGVEEVGHIPQSIGDIVEMPRSEVTFDPNNACSTGLHAGTYEYAKTYGNVCMKVVINPRDVVSVPNDERNQKIRVCRYVLVEVADEKIEAPIYEVPYSSFMGDELDEDGNVETEHCGLCGDDNCEDEECQDEEDDFYAVDPYDWD